jgi:hypothetical protein
MTTVAPSYRERLAADPRWALREGSMHFDKGSAVFRSLERITRRLDGLGVPYAVCGGMALFQHGYRRFTEDVDLLVSREGLQLIHEKLVGLGYVPPFAGSKNLRDTDTGVKIEFIVTGDFPGDGKPKPVAFPDPTDVAELVGGVSCLRLVTLVELKLASGTAAWRLKDLADVQEMIRALSLPLELAEQLHPFVRQSYRDQWQAVHAAPPE